MFRRFIPLVVLLSFTLSIQSQGRFRILDTSKKNESMTFSLINNLIVIEAEINGRKLNFLLDTGIKRTILFNLKFQDSLQLRNVEKIQLRGLGEGQPINALTSKGNYFKFKGIVNPELSLFAITDELFDLSYHGKNYHGWQMQANDISVQETIEKALTLLLKEEISVIGCGRTDAGVHARQFFLHFDVEIEIDKEKLKYKLNSFLPSDIAIFRLFRVNDEAHARFDAISRSYQYRISLTKNVFEHDLSLQMHQIDLDIEKMNEASALLMDYTDFKCFSRSKTDVKTYNCILTEAYWILDGEKLEFFITANRFLRNMVRAIVGTLLEVGKGNMNLNEFRSVIESRDRVKAGASVKAKGLFLSRVVYPESIYKD
jgi:tRNA pseudouridine38-40 synthase